MDRIRDNHAGKRQNARRHWVDQLEGRIKDGANIVDLFMEMKALKSCLEGRDMGLEWDFWFRVNKALK